MTSEKNHLNSHEKMYNDGRYIENNPCWHQEHSLRKADELFTLLEHHKHNLNFNRDKLFHLCEIGCGFGGVVSCLAQKIENYWKIKCAGVGIDISQIAVENAKQRFGGTINFIVGDINHLPPDNDILVVADLIEHLLEPETFLQQASHRTHYALFRVPLEHNLWNILLGKKKLLLKELGHLHYYTYNDALKLLQHNGFEIMGYSFTNNFSCPTNCRTLISKVMAPLRSALSSASQKINSLSLGGNSMVILTQSTFNKKTNP